MVRSRGKPKPQDGAAKKPLSFRIDPRSVFDLAPRELKRRHLDMEIDAIEQWAGNPRAIARDLVRRATATPTVVAQVAAPTTIGAHIMRRRRMFGLSQAKVGARLEVNASTVLNREEGRTAPPVLAFPAIFRFLGYNPFSSPRTLSERMQAVRRALGPSDNPPAVGEMADPVATASLRGP